MARILLSAMYSQPNRGSEEGVGWNFAVGLARAGHAVTLLTHERYRPHIDSHDDNVAPGSLDPVYVDDSAWVKAVERLRRLPDQMTHEIWQFVAYRFVRRHLDPDGFDLIWHATIGVVRQASLLYGFRPPFVFGPVAGGETSPWSLRSNFSVRDHLTESLRDGMNMLMPCDPVLQRMFAKTTCVLARSPETRGQVPTGTRERTHCNLGIGVDQVVPEHAAERQFEPGQPLKILFVGRLLYWKQPLIAIDAFQRFIAQGGTGELVVFGKGTLAARCRARIRRYGLEDRVRIIDFLPQEEFFDTLKASDVILFPSLHDGGGMVVLEGMAFGVPSVVFDLGGPGQLVTPESGRVVRSAGLSAAAAADAFAAELKTIQDDPALRARLRVGAVRRAQYFQWQAVVDRALQSVDAELARSASDLRLAPPGRAAENAPQRVPG